MPLYLTEDQTLLRDTARDFMAREAPVAHFRKYRDMGCKDGFAHGLWKQFAEMGFTGILVSEADGGLGMGYVEAGIVLEEIGRNLTPSPFFVSAVAVATALRTAPDEVRARTGGLDHVYAIHAADGEVLALVPERQQAFVVARQNQLSPVSVH